VDLVVGRVVKSHGIRGELVVDVRTDEPELRFARGSVLRGRLPRGGGERGFTVTAAREHSGRLLVSLDGVAGRDSADALRGTLFLIDSSEVEPSDDPDEFYDHELEGVPVQLADGTEVAEPRAAPSARSCTRPPANCCRSGRPARNAGSCSSRSSPRSCRRCRSGTA